MHGRQPLHRAGRHDYRRQQPDAGRRLIHLNSATSGATIACYASDDTAAIKAAVAAAVAYGQAHNGYAEILFDSVIYGVAAAPVIGTAVGGGNAQIPLPNIANTGQKLVLVFTSSTKGYDQALMHWLQTTPQAAGPVLACLSVAGTNDGTYGPSSMIGGPFRGYGGADLGSFSNCIPRRRRHQPAGPLQQHDRRI